MTVALVWPLNAAVLGPFASAMTAPTEQLLIGLPDGLAADFRSHQQLIEAHASSPVSGSYPCKRGRPDA